MPKILDVLDPGFHAGLKNMLAARREADEDIGEAVRSIIADVRENGDEALIALTARFDGFAPTARSLRVTAEELEQAAEKCEPGTIEALKTEAARIDDFHRRQLPQ